VERARSENFPALPESPSAPSARGIAWIDWHGKRLDGMLASAGPEILGGTSFFWPAKTPGADARSSLGASLLLAGFRENPNCCASAACKRTIAGEVGER
jgi:hypothetical protein